MSSPIYHRPLRSFHPTHVSHKRGHWSSRTWRKHRYHPGHEPNREWWEREHKEVGRRARLEGNISFWLAVTFVAGSIAWVINGFLLFLPIASPSKYPENSTMAAAFGFIGGTIFEFGSYLMLVEALNAGQDQLFGDALKDEVDWGSNSWRDLAFLASAVQLAAASIFWVATLTGLPGIIPNLNQDPPRAIAVIFYWTPQVVGGLGFTISSVLLMLEVQRAWWKPKLDSLGWHVGLFNLIASVGFTLCGALGYASYSSSGAEYQSALCTFWGGWAFLIGSAVQLWESVWKDERSS